MSRQISLVVVIVVSLGGGSLHAQSAPPAQFDVVSIKPNTSPPGSGGGIRTLPDGTYMMTNQPIGSIIGAASPVPVRLSEVEGLPGWAMTERYDVTAKPPAGATREQIAEMMRNMFVERMKLAAHIEERQRDTFALVLARGDGRLGPQIRRSALDCDQNSTAPAPPSSTPPAAADMQQRCGMLMNARGIVSGGITIDRLVLSLGGVAGGIITDRTGLEGWYALTLTFSPRRGLSATALPPAPDDPPDIFIALQEQLGLKLQPEKTIRPIFVIDHIERPTEN